VARRCGDYQVVVPEVKIQMLSHRAEWEREGLEEVMSIVTSCLEATIEVFVASV
jgi:hypothetical protein